MENAGRGTQVARERSAKPLHVGSIPTRASSISRIHLNTWDLDPLGDSWSFGLIRPK